jgi:hypothetical protein
MAFFGLTALGPQNTFAASSRHHRNLQIFEDTDFQAAWDKVNGRNALYCKVSKLEKVFTTLFHGPVPETDIGPLQRGLSDATSGADTITVDLFMKTMNRLRKEAEEEESKWEGKPKPECEFISSKEFQESLRKNAAIKNDLQTKLTVPLTGAQEVIISYTFSFPNIFSLLDLIHHFFIVRLATNPPKCTTAWACRK